MRSTPANLLKPKRKCICFISIFDICGYIFFWSFFFRASFSSLPMFSSSFSSLPTPRLLRHYFSQFTLFKSKLIESAVRMCELSYFMCKKIHLEVRIKFCAVASSLICMYVEKCHLVWFHHHYHRRHDHHWPSLPSWLQSLPLLFLSFYIALICFINIKNTYTFEEFSHACPLVRKFNIIYHLSGITSHHIASHRISSSHTVFIIVAKFIWKTYSIINVKTI